MGLAFWAGAESVSCIIGLHGPAGLGDFGFFRLDSPMIDYSDDSQGRSEKEAEIGKRLQPSDLFPFGQKNKPRPKQDQENQQQGNGPLHSCTLVESYISRKGQFDSMGKSNSYNLTARTRVFAGELIDAGLLSEEGWRATEQKGNIPQGLKP